MVKEATCRRIVKTKEKCKNVPRYQHSYTPSHTEDSRYKTLLRRRSLQERQFQNPTIFEMPRTLELVIQCLSWNYKFASI